LSNMQAKNQIKHFTCNIHPSEVIQRVYLEQGADTSLRCIECILSGTEKVSKDAMMTLNDFIENAVKQYQTYRRVSSLQSEAPSEFVSFLAQEDERIQKLSQQVEKEKERVNAAFNTILQEFTVLCHAKKEEIARQLDKQVITLKLNYTYYKSKVDKYYSKDNENDLNPDKDTLIGRINNCEDTNQMEVLVKNIKDDLQEASSHQDPQLKMNEIKESMKCLAQELQEQAASIPKSKFCDQSAIEESLKKFREITDSLMEDFVDVDTQISELSFTNFVSIDSKIVKKQEDVNLLKKWLAPSNQYFRLKLLYRGSRDGMNADVFHKKCDNHASTLTIAKSNYGKVFGGYSDQTWNVTNNYKASQKAWLFSIDEKQKFPIMSHGQASAIYAQTNYGPTFGSGHDLYIYLAPQNQLGGLAGGFNFGGGAQSYSNLGNAYQFDSNQKGGKMKRTSNKSTAVAGGFGFGSLGGNQLNQTILAGAYQFNVEEVEVYSVETKKESASNPSGSSEFDSVIIDPKQDLNLVKSWLGRGKKHDLELIYRGSRDGFTASNFHQSCDDVGPTLVVCKSKAYEKVFGGYTSKNWSQGENYVDDPEAFLFSLSNSTKLPVSESSCAIYCSSMTGPTFGAGHDLFICSDSNIVESSSSVIGMTYKANDNMGDLSTYLGGASSFMIDEIEVFTVKSS